MGGQARLKSDLMAAISQLSTEKGVSRDVVLKALEDALITAYKKDAGRLSNQKVTVRIDPQTGRARVFAHKVVVEEVTDPHNELSVEEARRTRMNVKLGETVEIESTPPNFGRIAAQTAKQVVTQRLREAEREMVYEEFVGREGDMVSGVVQRVEPKVVILDLGKAEGVLPISEQVRSEQYRAGQRLRCYLLEVGRTNRGPQLVVSRAHKNFLKRLFELEVPEVYNGVVELKAIAREAGSRSKVAVASRQEGVDPVGSCVGVRGMRIQNIVNEVNGEKIDVVEWDPEPAVFVANALSPARVLSVEINEAERTAIVTVPEKQLSLAIGKEGQNARLAAKLTNLRIDIKAASPGTEGPEPVSLASRSPSSTARVEDHR